MVVQNVIDGALTANTEFGSQFHPARIWYVKNDSPRPDLYQYAAFCIVRNLATDPGAFKTALPTNHAVNPDQVSN